MKLEQYLKNRENAVKQAAPETEPQPETETPKKESFIKRRLKKFGINLIRLAVALLIIWLLKKYYL